MRREQEMLRGIQDRLDNIAELRAQEKAMGNPPSPPLPPRPSRRTEPVLLACPYCRRLAPLSEALRGASCRGCGAPLQR